MGFLSDLGSKESKDPDGTAEAAGESEWQRLVAARKGRDQMATDPVPAGNAGTKDDQATAITGPGIASAAGFNAPDLSQFKVKMPEPIPAGAPGTPDQASGAAKGLGGRMDEQANQRDHIMQFFAFAHLPAHLAKVSEPFAVLASHIVLTVPRNRERDKALDRLLEAKDAAVRAVVAK